MSKYFYWIMMLAGIILPYTKFVPWSMSDGNLGNILPLAFSNQISAGITLDALVAGAFLVGMMILGRKEMKVKNIWIPVAGIFMFGIAFAYPCYFYLRSMVENKPQI